MPTNHRPTPGPPPTIDRGRLSRRPRASPGRPGLPSPFRRDTPSVPLSPVSAPSPFASLSLLASLRPIAPSRFRRRRDYPRLPLTRGRRPRFEVSRNRARVPRRPSESPFLIDRQALTRCAISTLNTGLDASDEHRSRPTLAPAGRVDLSARSKHTSEMTLRTSPAKPGKRDPFGNTPCDSLRRGQ